MLNLFEYLGKRIEITYKDGEIIKGLADIYTSAADDEEMNEESISILPESQSGTGRWVYKSEIESIKIVK